MRARACACVCVCMYVYACMYACTHVRMTYVVGLLAYYKSVNCFGSCVRVYRPYSNFSLYQIAFISADIFRFDNTYSWMTNKKIYYELELMEVSKDPMFKERKPTVAVAGAVEEVTHL